MARFSTEGAVKLPLAAAGRDLEQDAQRIAEAVLTVLRDNGDNLAVLAAIRRALVEKLGAGIE